MKINKVWLSRSLIALAFSVGGFLVFVAGCSAVQKGDYFVMGICTFLALVLIALYGAIILAHRG